MRVFETTAAMKEYSLTAKRQGLTIGYVPTMGALHEGHLSLIRQARQDTDRVVISIFVNPLQFGPGEDFDRYPRDTDTDLKLCKKENVDAVFMPSVADVYPKGFQTFVDQDELPKKLCGAFKPGHFKGVMTVVAKLFNIIKPDISYFGQKDYQQSIIIHRMAIDLDFDTQIKIMPTVREESGLALSSRNKYLGPKQKKEAAAIHEAMLQAKELTTRGLSSTKELIKAMKKHINSRCRGATIEYIQVVNPETLVQMREVRGKVMIVAAVYIGKARLIDNLMIE